MKPGYSRLLTPIKVAVGSTDSCGLRRRMIEVTGSSRRCRWLPEVSASAVSMRLTGPAASSHGSRYFFSGSRSGSVRSAARALLCAQNRSAPAQAAKLNPPTMPVTVDSTPAAATAATPS